MSKMSKMNEKKNIKISLYIITIIIISILTKKSNYFRNSQKISNIIYFNQSKMH